MRRSVTVAAPAERAFAVFTEHFDSWWPADYFIGAAAPQVRTMEPWAGGRWYERAADGRECDWGRVLAFQPPDRVLLAWQIDGRWELRPGPGARQRGGGAVRAGGTGEHPGGARAPRDRAARRRLGVGAHRRRRARRLGRDPRAVRGRRRGSDERDRDGRTGTGIGHRGRARGAGLEGLHRGLRQLVPEGSLHRVRSGRDGRLRAVRGRSVVRAVPGRHRAAVGQGAGLRAAAPAAAGLDGQRRLAAATRTRRGPPRWRCGSPPRDRTGPGSSWSTATSSGTAPAPRRSSAGCPTRARATRSTCAGSPRRWKAGAGRAEPGGPSRTPDRPVRCQAARGLPMVLHRCWSAVPSGHDSGHRELAPAPTRPPGPQLGPAGAGPAAAPAADDRAAGAGGPAVAGGGPLPARLRARATW